MVERQLERKYKRLQQTLRSLRRVIVAFSGGADSTLVLKVAVDTLGADDVLAATGRSASVPAAELEQAGRLARHIGAEHVLLDTDEFRNDNYLSNPTNRCYYCKTSLYEHLSGMASRHGPYAIVNGTNADDRRDHRPGLLAAREFEVHAPLAEAGLTKEDVRKMSERLGLPTHDKPASPCLSSRIQYGETITPQKLRMIEAAEGVLHGLGLRECRVRHHDQLARIEVPPQDIAHLAEPDVRRKIDEAFRRIGYRYVALDLHGFRSGSMNEVIAFGVAQ